METLNNAAAAAPETEASLNACLPALLEALGWRGNHSRLAEVFPASLRDMPLADTLSRLRRLGFEGTRVKRPAAHAERLRLPAMARDRSGEWHCLIQAEDGGCLAYDGRAMAYRHLEAQALRELVADSLCLAFSASGDQPESKVGPFWLQDLASRNRGPIAVALGFSFVLSIFGVLTPQMIGLLYREIDTMVDPSNLAALGLGAVLFVAGEVVFNLIRFALLSHLRLSVGDTIGREALRRVLYFPLSMTAGANPGAQIARIREFEDLAKQLSQPVTIALLDLPFIAIMLIALGLFAGVMVVVPLVAIALFLLIATLLFPVVRKTEQEAAAISALSQTRLSAILDNGLAIQKQGVEGHWKRSLEEGDRLAFPAQQTKTRLSSGLNFLSHGLVSLAGMAAVLTGVFQALDGQLPASALLAAMMLVWRILDPCRSIFILFGTIQGTTQTAQRLQKFMAMSGERQADPRRPTQHLEHTGVRVDGLYVKYPQANRFALANISVTVPPLGSLAVSGHAGCGKTTLCHALLGLVEASSGRVMIGDQAIQQYDPASLRKSIAYLPTRIPLLPLSIRENLLLARADASEAELKDALDHIGALGLVELLPQGIDTIVDTDRMMQDDFARRIGIARLWLMRSRLWLLDNPDYGLDPETRRLFLEQLRGLRGRVTLIILGNDPEFTALCDTRMPLEQGRQLVENRP